MSSCYLFHHRSLTASSSLLRTGCPPQLVSSCAGLFLLQPLRTCARFGHHGWQGALVSEQMKLINESKKRKENNALVLWLNSFQNIPPFEAASDIRI